jgi:hypothetical protein
MNAYQLVFALILSVAGFFLSMTGLVLTIRKARKDTSYETNSQTSSEEQSPSLPIPAEGEVRESGS